MKTKKYVSLLLCALLLIGLLTGCGSGSKAMTSAASYDMAVAEEAPAAMNAAGGTLTESGTSGSTVLPESRKWIVTVYLSAETEDLDALMADLDETIAGLNGYVEDQSVYNGSTYSSRRYRNASLTVRIPAEDVDQFTQQVAGIANMVSKETNRQDVTLNYVATESRMTALQTEEARLLELMAQAETMSDLLEIEERLTDVRYELESVTSQLRLYDNQIDYATIYLSISEVQEYTPVEEPTLWERISGGFRSSLKDLGDGAVDLLVWVIVNSPYLVILAAVIVVIVLILKRRRKRRQAKKNPPQDSQTP
ncbi:MAG: DUF4349 domain-containing protein [Faecousia sp.]